MTRRASSLGTLLLASLPPALAAADGFEHPDNGTVAVGRAGAFTARASDGSAIQYNIAGLAAQRGTRLLVNLNLTDPNLCFDRSGSYSDSYRDESGAQWPWNDQEYPEVCDESSFLDGLGPMLAFSTDFGNRRLPVFVFGVHGPSSPERMRYPETVRLSDGTVAPAPQRYDLVSRKTIVLYPMLGVAYEVLPWLRVGTAFQAVFASLQFSNAITTSGGENPLSDLHANLDTLDPFTPAVLLAAQARFAPIDIGVAFRYSGDFDADGDVTFERGPFTGSDITPPFSDAKVHAGQAPSVRAGVRYFHSRGAEETADPMADELFDVELDVVWEGNSAFDSLDIEIVEDELQFVTGLDPLNVADPKVDHSWRDTISFRLGGDVNVLPGQLALRTGFSFEEGAAPLTHTRIDFLAFQRIGIHLGATYRLGSFDISAGGAYLAQSPRTVQDGKTYRIGPFGTEEGENQQITDGRYESSLVVLSLGTSYRF